MAQAFKGADVRKVRANNGDGDGLDGNGKIIFDMGAVLSALSILSGENVHGEKGGCEELEQDIVIDSVEKKEKV